MSLSPFIITLLCLFTDIISGQVNYGCPKGWHQFQTKCYQFVDSPLMVYEEAIAACWFNGAQLVSLDSDAKNTYITKWIKSNIPIRAGYWYTSGYYYDYDVLWEGTGQFHTGKVYWADDQPPPPNIKSRVVLSSEKDFMWSNITASTPGSYVCEVHLSDAPDTNIMARDFSYGSGFTDLSHIERGPVITRQPRSVVVFEGVQSVEITCLATGQPLPTYQFLATGNENITKVFPNDRYTLTAGKLTITGPDQTIDSPTYQVMVSNSVGTVLSDTADIIFGSLGYFSNVKPDVVIAEQFMGQMIECDRPSYTPRVVYSWFTESVNYVHFWEDYENFFVSQSGRLYISSVQPTEVNREYFCTVSLVGTENAELGEANMLVRTSMGHLLTLRPSASSDNDYGPILYTHVLPVPTMRGGTIRMECVAYGKLPLRYTWYREDGQSLGPTAALSDRNRVLTITNATLSAEGNYVCECQGGSGETSRKVVTLTMESKPYFPFGINNKFADPGKTLNWFCKAVGHPTPHYTWFKNGQQIQQVSEKIEITDGGKRLKIINVKRGTDEGMYQCAATNDYGTTYSSGRLKILLFKPSFDKRPLPQVSYGAMNGNTTIPCGVEGAPVPEIKWLKDGSDLGITYGAVLGSRIYMDTAFTLHITGVQMSDGGYYTCQAVNSEGEARNHTTLIVEAGARIRPSADIVRVQVNDTAFLFCQADYDYRYDVAYVWKLNGVVINYILSPEYVTGTKADENGLYIVNARYQNEGVYECEVKTPLNTVAAKTTLIVYGPPGPVAGVYAELATETSQSVVLVWTVTVDMEHHGDITGFDIEAMTSYKSGTWFPVMLDIDKDRAVRYADDIGKRGDQCAWNVTGLVPNTNYRFRIRAINMYGRGQEASNPSTSIHTGSMPPVTAPKNVGGGGGTVGVLKIKWQPFDVSEHCGPGIGYNVYWKRLSDTRDWRKEKVNDSLAVMEGIYVTTVGVENYYLPYLAKVGAYNDIGDGPNSTEVQIFSAEGMPQVVPVSKDVETFNGTSIIPYWEPVEEYKGSHAWPCRWDIGYMYVVYYYANVNDITPFDGSEPDEILNDIKFKDVYGQTDHAQLVGLKSNCEFFTRVQVFNGAGFGPKGEWRRSETANTPLRQHPVQIKIYQHGPYSIVVKWQGVVENYDESSLEGYIVRVWKVHEDVRTAVDTLSFTEEAIVYHLQQNQVYVLRVLGFSSSGDGAISEARYFMITSNTLQFYSVSVDPAVSQMCFYEQYSGVCDGTEALSDRAKSVIIVGAIFLTVLSTNILSEL
ncbi:contactin-5-like [Dreissena polymorpha]|uniref:contactin-5-like n=1 Tax=Dreissena polymorpha TaxID=45954 RepID=UPI002263EB63|nr:contactin-5-like [Dreissena polymorpha]